MSRRTHYQAPDSSMDGEGNFNPIACGVEDAWRVSTQWCSVTCRRCLAKKRVKTEEIR